MKRRELSLASTLLRWFRRKLTHSHCHRDRVWRYRTELSGQSLLIRRWCSRNWRGRSYSSQDPLWICQLTIERTGWLTLLFSIDGLTANDKDNVVNRHAVLDLAEPDLIAKLRHLLYIN
jgi:hypothetical protein